MPDYTHIKGVYINTPCHENWETMSDVERGRFCNVCSKTVYDFTNAEPAEFFKAWRENKGQVCGRFIADDPGFWQTQHNTVVRLLRHSKAAILAIGMGILSITAIKAQAGPPNKFGKLHMISFRYQSKSVQKTPVVDDNTGFVTLSFNIKDEDTRELILKKFTINIGLKEYDLTINDVSNGIATFQIPAEMAKDSALIEVKGEGYEPLFIKLDDANQVSDVYLKNSIKAQKEKEKQQKEREKKFTHSKKSYRQHWWQVWKPKRRMHVLGACVF